MKHDRISVCRDRTEEREKESEATKMQREADKDYFHVLRETLFERTKIWRYDPVTNEPSLVPDPPCMLPLNKECTPVWTSPDDGDVLLECTGSLTSGVAEVEALVSSQVDTKFDSLPPALGGSRSAHFRGVDSLDAAIKLEASKSGEHLRPSRFVRCHSFIVHRRCPWLGRLMARARTESVTRLATGEAGSPKEEPSKNPTGQGEVSNGSDIAIVPEVEAKHSDATDHEDDDIEMLNYQPQRYNNEPIAAIPLNNGPAAQIEADDERRSVASSVLTRPSSKGEGATSSLPAATAALPTVAITNHPPEAMLLLLEYCYTNRVIPLGMEAFVQSCRTKPGGRKQQGPVSPYSLGSSASRLWPKRGEPSVPFSVAVAGIRLAEEAGLKRLSLMCEIAAGQQVTPVNAIQALILCHRQNEVSGNDLPRLRKAAMDVLYWAGKEWNFFEDPIFREALKTCAVDLIPTMFAGTKESFEEARGRGRGDGKTSYLDSRDHDWKELALSQFGDLDKEDQKARERERRVRRNERRGAHGKESKSVPKRAGSSRKRRPSDWSRRWNKRRRSNPVSARTIGSAPRRP
jgi:hypothetical protein